MYYNILKNIFKLDDVKIKELEYNFIGMEDGWLCPNEELIELYRLLNKNGDELHDEKNCSNSWTKRIRKKYAIRRIKKLLNKL